MVEDVVRAHGLPYQHHASVWLAIRSHYRLLKSLGQPCGATSPAGLAA